MMAKAQINTGPDGTKYLHFYCPGCEAHEAIPIERGSDYKGPIWDFSGTLDSPTLTASPSGSVRHFHPNPGEEAATLENTTCHYHLINGILNYCGDCKHKYNGQQIPLPDLDLN